MENEKRLIDANALAEKFREHKELFLNKMGGFQALLQREKGRVDELDNCIAEIINAPTVDAVEVVRCKDCKHYDKDALWCDINSPQLSESHMNWYEDDFCSIGEKQMDGDGNG